MRRFALVVVAFALVLHGAATQEKSVRPGINKSFEKPDVKDLLHFVKVERPRRGR